MIRLILADDEKLIRSGLKIMLESTGDVTVVGEASRGREAYELCGEQEVDAVLMDIRMPESNGIEGTRLIKRDYPHVVVLMLTTFEDTEYIVQAMEMGASGYMLKDNDPEAIYEGLRVALTGKVVMDKKISQKLLTHRGVETDENLLRRFDLNQKELDIIRHVAEGLNNKEIAERMYLSEGTVKNNVSYILSKLELRDRTQLAIFAFEHKIK